MDQEESIPLHPVCIPGRMFTLFSERMMRKHRIKKEGGSALLLTLLVITILTGLTLAFSEESAMELDLASYAKDSHHAYEMARSGVNLALAMLHQDKDQDMDSHREAWARFGTDPFPDELPEDIHFSGSITDESGKININALIDEEGKIDMLREAQLRRLFRTLNLVEEMADPLFDWLDEDDVQRLEGAESDFYQGLSSPYRCPNGPLITIGQLFLVKGMYEVNGSDDNRKLLDYLTIYSDGKVNINTAPKEVLECLSNKMDTTIAEAIVAFRRDGDFTKKEDLRKVPGMDDALYKLVKPWITIKSSAVSIESQGKCRGAVGRIRAIVQRNEKGPRVIYWKVQ